MYEENENKIDWKDILKKLGIIVGGIVIVLLFIIGVSKCTKKDDKPKIENTPVDLTSQLDQLEEATLKYLTKENLPVEINASKTIRLKILTNRNIITEIRDSENNKCDLNESYSEVTRLENNYAVKMSLTCGMNKDYRVIYIGCFEECNGEICKGSESSTNGTCTITTTTPDPTQNQGDSTSTTTTTTTKPNTTTSTTKKTTTTTKKPTTTTKPFTTTKKEVLYEYQRCTTTPAYCTIGTPVNGRCEKGIPYTEYGTVKKDGGETQKVNVGTPQKVKVSSTTVYLNSTSEAKDTDLVKYTNYGGYVSGKGHKYTKTTYKYQCTNGNPSSDGKACYDTTTTPVSYSCLDKSFTYNKSTGQCTKMSFKTEYYELTPANTTCETTWSKSTSLAGWTRTGRTK